MGREALLQRSSLVPGLVLRRGKPTLTARQGGGKLIYLCRQPQEDARSLLAASLFFLVCGGLIGFGLGREPLRQELIEREETINNLDILLTDRSCFLAAEVEDSLRRTVGPVKMLEAGWPHEIIRDGISNEKCHTELFVWPEPQWKKKGGGGGDAELSD